MKKMLLATTAVMAMAGPVMAGQCPGLMTQIDEAMATATVDDATKASIMALYETGKAKHESGDHAGSVADLNEALNLLGG